MKRISKSRRTLALRAALLQPLESRTLLSVAGSTLAGPQTTNAVYTFRELFQNQTVGTFTRTIVGPTTFQTHPVTEVDESDNPTNGAASFVQRFYAFDSNLDYISYGSVSNGATTIDNPAAIIFPTGIAAGTTSTNSYTAISSSSGGNTSSQITDIIELVPQSGSNPEATFALTTPAGTFQVYEVDEARSITTDSTSTVTFQHFISPLFGEVEFTESLGSNTETFQLTSLTGLGNITPSPAAAQLAFVQQPTTAVANTTLTPALTVDVEDSSGNLVTTDNSVVTLAIASGNGTLGGTLTARAVNGVATFANLTLPTAGTYTLTATDPTLTAATSSSFTITPAAPIQPLAVTITKSTLPATVVAGAKSNATISVSITNPNATPITEKVTITVQGQLTTPSVARLIAPSAAFGTLTKKITVKANSSIPLSLKLKAIPVSIVGELALTAQLTDPAGNIIFSPAGPEVAVNPATISLVPSAPSLVTAKSGTGSLTILLTNTGNSPASGSDTFTLVTAADTALAAPITVFTKSENLKITNAKNKKIKLKLTAAEVLALNASPVTVLEVTDYKGDTQTLLLKQPATDPRIAP